MRGAITYTEMMDMTLAEKQVVADFIEKRLDNEKKSAFPVY